MMLFAALTAKTVMAGNGWQGTARDPMTVPFA
jgi:hypothetical protein